MTIHWKAVKHYFTEVLVVFQFYPVCNFGEFISFGLGTVRSEKIKVIAKGILKFYQSQKIEIQIKKRGDDKEHCLNWDQVSLNCVF